MPKKIKKKKPKKSKAVQSQSAPNIEFMDRPGIADRDAPEGFRSISLAQAPMEYNRPLMEHAKGSSSDLNEILQIGMLLWNYSIAFHKGEEDSKIRTLLLAALKEKLKFSIDEAEAFLNKMVERYNYLFPKGIQPPVSSFLFIRKEKSIAIEPFDYTIFDMPQDIIPPHEKDTDLINKIKQLDNYMVSEIGYDEFEDLMFIVINESEERFQKWLADKGLSKNIEQFNLPGCIELYLQFIYGYMHNDLVTLKIISLPYILEFFEDYLLRKMMVQDPNHYVLWVPALKLFYRFLYEKEYIADPDDIIGAIDSIEPDFIGLLRKQFD